MKYQEKKDGRYLISIFSKSNYGSCCIALGLTMRPLTRHEVAVSVRGEFQFRFPLDGY